MKKQTNKIAQLKSKLRLRIIIGLGLLLSINAFAWFVYSTTISTSITASVKSWKIAFESNNEVVQYISFKIDDLYPGMPDFDQEVKIMNEGDVQASVKWTITELRIMDDIYTEENYNNDELLQILNANPFQSDFRFDKLIIGEGGDSTNFSIHVQWAYESGDDEADTLWGYNAHEYKELNPGKDIIEVTIMLVATQIN